jgi:hypothetical protein
MLDAILGLASSSGLGVIAGLVGSFLAKREERKVLELSNAHETNMATIDMERDSRDQAHDIQMADKQMDMAAQEGEIAADVAELGNIGETIKAQSKLSGNVVVDGILRFVRPFITFYLLVVLSIIGYQLHKLTGGLESLPTDDVFELYQYLIHQIIFLTVTAVTWWFGSRGAQVKPR